MEIAEISGLRGCSAWWSELPKNLKENVLAWLPAEILCRDCGVCKEWNALFTSTQFITNDWLCAPPNKKPWLLLFHDFDSLNCMAYCFFTDTWKRLSLAFLKNQYTVAGFWVDASVAGLFLGTIDSFNPRGYYEWKLIVCNPLTGKSIELPRIEDSVIRAMTMVAEEGHGHNGGTYKVIAVVISEDAERVEIYDSILKSWSTAGHLPHLNFATSKIVGSGDFLYVNSMDANSSRKGIVAFSIQNGTSVFTPLPLEDVDNSSRRYVLFTCGSRVLLGSCICDTDENIIIWELENSHSSMIMFTEIARMPLILDSYRRHELHYGCLMFSFEGTRNLVCITLGDDVLVYNLNQKTSTWLPRCPVPQHWGGIPAPFVFEARPDMDV